MNSRNPRGVIFENFCLISNLSSAQLLLKGDAMIHGITPQLFPRTGVGLSIEDPMDLDPIGGAPPSGPNEPQNWDHIPYPTI